MSFSLYCFDAEAVNDVERYAMGIQAIFAPHRECLAHWCFAIRPALEPFQNRDHP